MIKIMAFVPTYVEITLVPVMMDILEMVLAALVWESDEYHAPIFVFLNIIDLDECQTGADDCESMNAECNNTIGSFECYCRNGYRFNGTYCESIHMEYFACSISLIICCL